MKIYSIFTFLINPSYKLKLNTQKYNKRRQVIESVTCANRDTEWRPSYTARIKHLQKQTFWTSVITKQ